MTANSLLHRNCERGQPHAFNQNVAGQYWRKVLATQGAHLIRCLPNWEVDGLSSYDWSAAGDHAVSVGLGTSAANPEGLRQTRAFNGTPSHINLLSTGFTSSFNGQEGALLLWAKAASAGLWTDGNVRLLANFTADADNILYIYRDGANNVLRYELHCQAVTTAVVQTLVTPSTDWMMLGLTWSKAANALIAYWNGLPFGTPATVPNPFTGVLTEAWLGAFNALAQWPWLGYLAHAALWDVPLTAPEMLSMAEV